MFDLDNLLVYLQDFKMGNELAKHLVEVEIDDWQQGITECSFDAKNETDPPSKDRVGKPTERFIVTRNEISRGVTIVRNMATIGGCRHPIPEVLMPVFNKSQAHFCVVMSMNFYIKELTRYHASRVNAKKERIAEVEDKLNKVMRFTDTIRQMLTEIVTDLGSPDLVDIPIVNEHKPVVVRRSAPQATKPREVIPKKPKFQLSFDED